MSFIEEQTIGKQLYLALLPPKNPTTEFSSTTNRYTVTYFNIKFNNDGNTVCNTILGKESEVKIEIGKI